MIIHTFLRWVDTAKVSDRSRAASALGRAFRQQSLKGADQHAAELAMTFLLDDPSPKVRLSLAEAIADSAQTPRSLILPLAADQPEIAYTVISRSPVLTDDDLVDLAACGTAELRGVIAARRQISPAVSAAIGEIGGLAEMMILLDNPFAHLIARTLRRIAERFGHVPQVRERLLNRAGLPSDVRHILIEKVGQALALSGLVRAVVGGERVDRIAREACDNAAVEMAGTSPQAELPRLVTHLRDTGRLTPAFLLHALVTGRIDFFATSIVILSTLSERRVRSILSDGRLHAIRALFQSAGLSPELGALFARPCCSGGWNAPVSAAMKWRAWPMTCSSGSARRRPHWRARRPYGPFWNSCRSPSAAVAPVPSRHRSPASRPEPRARLAGSVHPQTGGRA